MQPARADWILFTSFHASWDHNMMLSSANQGRRPEEFVKPRFLSCSCPSSAGAQGRYYRGAA